MTSVAEILDEIKALPEEDRHSLLQKLGAEIAQSPRRLKTHIEFSTVTGLPVLVAEPNAPQITSERVHEVLAEFP